MKYLSLIILFLFITNCTTKTTYKKPTWLVGKWKRINNKPNTVTYEFWNTNLSGTGFTLTKNDTTFKEILHITTINDTLFLKVSGVNETPTLFKITKQTDSSFTAENPTHDFPTRIEYWKENQQLKAKVSNKEFAIDFVFDKYNLP